MTRVAIVGGGLVGSAAAVWLAADGFDVTVFERDPEGRPASTGNASVISLPEISPLARVSTLLQVPKWMADPLGPLTLRARDLPALTPWLMRFVASSRPAQVERTTSALAFLMKTAIGDHQELARRAGIPLYARRNGALYLYDTDSGFRSGLTEWRERERHGVEHREVSADEARAMVPALQGPFARAIFAPDSWSATNPLLILTDLRAAVAAKSKFETGAVVDIRRAEDGVTVVTSGGAEQKFDRVVVAGGVWSRDLVSKLGLRVLLETERGYNTTYPDPGFEIPMPVFFSSHGFVASPLVDGLRVGGAVELAAVDAPPNFARAAAMRKKARRYLPALPEEGGKEWMGCRPSTPDSLPVISAHPDDRRIVFAFGHGHLGLTLSAVTARHTATLVAGTRDRNLDPFSIARFQ